MRELVSSATEHDATTDSGGMTGRAEKRMEFGFLARHTTGTGFTRLRGVNNEEIR